MDSSKENRDQSSNLPKPQLVAPEEPTKETRTQTPRCPLASSGKRRRRNSIGSVLRGSTAADLPSPVGQVKGNDPLKMAVDNFDRSTYFDEPLTPVGGKQFYRALGIDKESPTKLDTDLPKPKRPMGTPHPRKALAQAAEAKPRRPIKQDDPTTLFKEDQRRSATSVGLMRLFWLLVEWISGWILSNLSPTPIPESSRAQFQKRRKAPMKRETTEPKDDAKFHLGFTPMVRRQRPPL